MRLSCVFGVLAANLSASVALAQQPMNPYDPAAAEVPAPPAQPAPPAPPVPPAPPAMPAPPGAPAPYYYYPYPPQPAPYYQYPYYYGQQVVPRREPSCAELCGTRAVGRRRSSVRHVALGAHGTYLGLDQTVFGRDVRLPGFGIHMRFRSSGHFGFEVAQDFLHQDILSGRFVRDTFPFSLSAMLYLAPNTDAHHFNVFLLGGGGVIGDSVRLYDEFRRRVTQDFTEFEAHVGLGAELRFSWLAVSADVRGLVAKRYNENRPASYYEGIAGGPVPDSSRGLMGTLSASIWF